MTDAARENGNLDMRLFPAAICAWLSSLVCKTCGPSAAAVFIFASLACFALAVFLLGIHIRKKSGKSIKRIMHFSVLCMTLCAAFSFASAISSGLDILRESSDPASIAAGKKNSKGVFEVEAIAPMSVSDRRESDCKTDVSVSLAELYDVQSQNSVISPSAVTARLYSSGGQCNFVQGGKYRVEADISQAEYGMQKIWLTQTVNSASISAAEPSFVRKISNDIQNRFFNACRSLSDQGRILVPGLTLGVMGQDAYFGALYENSSANPGSPSNSPGSELDIDSVYSKRVENSFKNAGLMHLTAVSGSHFVLAADCARRICSAFLAHRNIRIFLTLFFYAVLIYLMYPSDSVIRAAIMGTVGLGACAIGRRPRALPCLNIAVITAIIFKPSLSLSLGFALSVASVFGILLLNGPASAFFARFLPKIISEPLSVTVSAQIFSLPVQTIMGGGIPLLSPLANLIELPAAEFATIFGLAALVCSAFFPQVAEILILISSFFTSFMEKTVGMLNNIPFGVLSWPDGFLGAVCVCLAYVCFTVFLLSARLFVRKISAAAFGRGRHAENYAGKRFRLSFRQRCVRWYEETCEMIFPDLSGDKRKL